MAMWQPTVQLYLSISSSFSYLWTACDIKSLSYGIGWRMQATLSPLSLKYFATYLVVCDLPTPVLDAQIAMTGFLDSTMVNLGGSWTNLHPAAVTREAKDWTVS